MAVGGLTDGGCLADAGANFYSKGSKNVKKMSKSSKDQDELEGNWRTEATSTRHN
jgi:hypothetical protein